MKVFGLGLILSALLAVPAFSQTVTVPPLSVPIPARIVPSQTITFTTARNGGRVTVTIPAQTLPAQISNTPSVTAPMTLGIITMTFSCSGPDMQHLLCAVKQ